jgi:hypothetical protein
MAAHVRLARYDVAIAPEGPGGVARLVEVLGHVLSTYVSSAHRVVPRSEPTLMDDKRNTRENVLRPSASQKDGWSNASLEPSRRAPLASGDEWTAGVHGA